MNLVIIFFILTLGYIYASIAINEKNTIQKNKEYLKDIPSSISKVLLVRKETIHIKHIFTEIFVKKDIDIYSHIHLLDMKLCDYMEFMTNRLRKIYNFPRTYKQEPNQVVSFQFNSLFRAVNYVKPLKTVIVLDFDGVITNEKFWPLYQLCYKRAKVIVCSANPTVTEEYFKKRDLPVPEIRANKGKQAKLKQLLEIHKRYDYTLYVDDEPEYLKIAWLFGIRTYQYKKGKIKLYSLNKG